MLTEALLGRADAHRRLQHRRPQSRCGSSLAEDSAHWRYGFHRPRAHRAHQEMALPIDLKRIRQGDFLALIAVGVERPPVEAAGGRREPEAAGQHLTL